MRLRGVNYDVGRIYMGHLMHPRFDLDIIRRELDIIKNDLHCNAVKIVGCEVDRLIAAAEIALQLGMEVWLSPDLFEHSQEETFEYTVEAAKRAESLRTKYPQVVLSIGTELTGFMKGILPGEDVMQRITDPNLWRSVFTGTYDHAPLNNYLARAVEAVRNVFRGPITYASFAALEKVDWSIFDFVGIDLYRDARNRSRYGDLIEAYSSYGKPVVVTEFGCCTYQGAEDAGGIGFNIIDWGKTPPELKGEYVYDQGLQARELSDQLAVIDESGVDGAFVFEFVQQGPDLSDPNISGMAKDLTFDMDIASFTLARSLLDGSGSTYPDMSWEPKESFRAVAEYYKRAAGSRPG